MHFKNKKQEMDSLKEGDSFNPFGTEETFFQAFMEMKDMVEECTRKETRIEKKLHHQWVPQEAKSSVIFEGERVGVIPLDPPSSPSSSSYSSEHSSHMKRNFKMSFHSHSCDLPMFKLDVKFDFPIYDGKLNAEKLDNYIK